MKITVNKNKFESHLNFVSNNISGKAIIPVTEYVKVEIGDHIKMTTSDMETTINVTFDYEEIERKEKEEIKFLFIPKELLQLIKMNPCEFIILEPNEKENKLHVQLGFDLIDLSILSKKEDISSFPVTEVDSYENSYELDISLLVETLKAFNGVNKVRNKDNMHEFSQYIHVESKNKTLTFVATDAHLLRIKEIEFNGTNPFVTNIPWKFIYFINKMSFNDGDKITLAYTEKQNIFRYKQENMEIEIVTVKGNIKYPNYEAVIPTDNPYKITVNKDDLLKAVKKAGIINFEIVFEINVTHNLLQISSHNVMDNKKIDTKVDAKFDVPDELTFAMSKNMFIEFLDNADGYDITIKSAGENKAFIINENKGMSLIMPIARSK